jgi:single-stranded-DNA-specific exonuclease
MKWNKKEIDPELVRSIASRYGIDLLPASILARRGITAPEEVAYFLESDTRYLHNPFLFVEMEDAVDRILAALEEGEKVLVFGDRDADGITSIVLMVSGLRELGLDVSWNLPTGDDPYGLTMRAVDECAERDVTLIITVDCGISCAEEIAYAAAKGIDTIVVDHHNPPETLPDAVAIINPKLEDCGYPFRDLAGCGVVSKVLWAVRFARSELYKQPVCLVNIRPGNEMLVIEAVKLVNLVEEERLVENVVPDILDGSGTRFVKFAEGQQLFVYGLDAQMRMFRKIFGPTAEIGLIDLAPELWKVFPSFAGKSLLRLKELSRMARFQGSAPAEIDIFSNLFIGFVQRREKKMAELSRKDLDLVALGTIADLMPLRNENRILVKQGLAVLQSAQRPGLRELVIRQNLLGRKLGTSDVAWQLSPVINAAGRMGCPEKAAELFLSEDPAERERLAEHLVELNKERKRLGDEIWEKILPQARESYTHHGNRLVLVSDMNIHRGVTGIIASRLVNFFKVPAAVIAHLPDSVVGSLRSTRGFDVKKLLDSCSDLFVDYGGHDFAAGFNMDKHNFERFEARVLSLVQSLEQEAPEEEAIEIDAEIPLSFMTPELLSVIETFEPFGEENPPIVLLSRGLKVASLDLIGRREQNHVRILFDTGTYKFPAVFWNAADRIGADLAVGKTVDVVYHLRKNYFQNTESQQLTVLDVS